MRRATYLADLDERLGPVSDEDAAAADRWAEQLDTPVEATKPMAVKQPGCERQHTAPGPLPQPMRSLPQSLLNARNRPS